jgi:predicted aspartyl protease
MTEVGNFTEEITLKNAKDLELANVGLLDEKDVRQATVQAMPDTGASLLFITEELCEKLGLGIEGDYHTLIGDGQRKPCKRTEALRIYWKNRDAICPAIVMPGVPRILLGAIPMEMMDLRVNPTEMRLEGAHGEDVVHLAL